MAYGGTDIEIHAEGSTQASAGQDQHLLLGDYEGLSNLNNDDSVNIKISSINNSFRYGASPSNNIGVIVQGGSGNEDIPSRRAGDASQLLVANADLDMNASIAWTIFRRVP